MEPIENAVTSETDVTAEPVVEETSTTEVAPEETPTTEACTTCAGTGLKDANTLCEVCAGSGV